MQFISHQKKPIGKSHSRALWVALALGVCVMSGGLKAHGQTIVDIAADNPDFSTLVTALQVTGLDAALQEAGPFTVFAPNNAAFDALPPGVLDDLIADPEALSQILLYHVAPGALLSDDLAAGPLVTLQGAAVTIGFNGDVTVDNATLIAPNIVADNGVIHVIDEVILPPPNIVEIAIANPDFSTLVTAVVEAGLAAALQEPGPFTVFAPTDAAFAALPPGVLDDLLANPDQLAQVLLYHVVPGRVRSTDLVDGPIVTLQGAAATVSLVDGVSIDGASVIAADIEASNGIIHVIDEVILPPPNIVEIAIGNAAFSTLVTAVVEAGLAADLQEPGPFTVFAPTDAAFAALPPGVLDDLLANPEELAEVLLYHVVPGRVRSTDLEDGKIVTLQGAAANISLVDGVSIDAASVIDADIEASNGIIHVIDEVILPPPNIVEIAISNPDFSTLVTAVVEAGLAEVLQGPGPFTVFAPTDAAFAALPAGLLDELLADPDRLRHILLYHVVHGRVRAGDLSDGSLTTMQGAPVQIDTSGPSVNQSGITATDIEARNGIIHVIDEVLLPADGFVANEVSFKRIGDEATLVWPAMYLGLSPILEFTDDLSSGDWTPVTAGIVTADDIQKITISLNAALGFYRVVYQ